MQSGYRIQYECPDCGHEWNEQWSCACDSTCPECGTGDIEASSYDLDGTATQDELDAYNAPIRDNACADRAAADWLAWRTQGPSN